MVLVPSDGGYAPDAISAELVLVVGTSDDGHAVFVESVNVPTARGGKRREIGAELHPGSVEIINVEQLTIFLDMHTKDPGHAGWAAEPVLKDISLLYQNQTAAHGRKMHALFHEEHQKLASSPKKSPWLNEDRLVIISYILPVIALVISFVAIAIAISLKH